jgi:dTDP-4-dehydrorhamnose 3,5-epimerase
VIFTATILKGAFLIEPERREDERGFFARIWCRQEFEEHGIDFSVVQCNVSYNKRKGTLRGMHYQLPPHEEAKFVLCTRGSIYDVIIDLRRSSSTFGQHLAVSLTAQNRRALYIPKGFAHGFQTLGDETEVLYLMSEFYVPGSARGVRWNDSAFGIKWPADERIISERDQNYPDFAESML